MTWSDLTSEAHVLYSSDSVIDILGYTPDEIVNRSAWDFFSKDELPYAQEFHRKRVVMDTAAVLAYCNVLSKDGQWITCECCFTIVYDVMIVCTSIYQRGGKSDSKFPTQAGTTDPTLTPPTRPCTRSTCRTAHLLFFAKGPEISHVVAHLAQVHSTSQTSPA
jgi:PAS domain S-box-containing protein